MSAFLTPTLLLILDGWGQAPAGPGNAVSLARTPTLDALLALPSRTNLACSGRAVGLPEGFIGNSEVGHLNIGAGRVVYQDLTRIDMAIENGAFAHAPALRAALETAQASGGTLHLLGLLSDGGVHSHIDHLFALLEAAEKADVPVAVHAFTDGRDTNPDQGLGFMRRLVSRLGPRARVATITGRYYAMDRDNRWDRTRLAWEALAHGAGILADDPVQAVAEAYAAGETDEFIRPRVLREPSDGPVPPRHRLHDGDAVFFFNFRADRARQLTRCLYDDAFSEFDRGARPQPGFFATMTEYDASMPVPAAFPGQEVANGLGETVSGLGVRQLRIAETEKYAHVTYFFNGGREEPFPGEDRHLVPSPRDVATYDVKPRMSAPQVTDLLIREWNSGTYDFVVCNLANMDMVGHTGSIPATVEACEVVDACTTRILEAVRARGGRIVVTADHGNAESMLTPENTPRTAHTTNPVALIVSDNGPPCRLRSGGKLGDIGPTILSLWGVPVPEEMTGSSLVED